MPEGPDIRQAADRPANETTAVPIRLQTTPDMMQPDAPPSPFIWQQMSGLLWRSLKYFFYLMVMAGMGIILGILVIHLPGPLLPPTSFWGGVAGVLLCLYAAVGLHELGHAAGGKIAGYQLVYIIVGPLRLGRELAGWRLRFAAKGLFSVGGWAYSVPTQQQGWRWRRLSFIGGGPLASLVLVVVVVGLRFAWQHTAVSPTLSFLLHMMTFAAIAVLPFSLIPMAIRGIRNDALLIIDTLRARGEAARRKQAINWLFAQSYRGLRPREIDANALAQALYPGDGSDEELLASIWGYYYEMDRQRPRPAAAHLDRALTILRERPNPTLATLCFMDAAFFEARHGQRPDIATAWLKLIEPAQANHVTNEAEMKLVYYRSRAAVLQANGETDAAHKEARQGLALLPRLVDQGGAKIEQEWLEQLAGGVTG